MTGSVLLVTNPLSGHGRGSAAAAEAAARLRQRGAEVTEVSGATAAESLRLVRDRLSGDQRPDAVVCAGGDGLVCLVLQALAGTGVPLGLVPGGTGNDLAREFGVPQHDPIAAADIVCNRSVRDIDLGEVHGTLRFATVAGTGFDARVTLRANRMRYPRGPLRYSVAALAELARGLAVPYRIELSDATIVETEAIMVAVGNTRTYGGGMMICPDAVVDDGQLDLTVVGAMSRREMLRMLPALSSGKRIDHPAISQYRAAEITLTAPGAPVTADGDPAGALPAHFRALPGAQPVIVP
ncbi:diacylglycerol kinase (ATP) [Nocardia sp. GAS34]|uniref:YegS/Rv2252/BmrU family lipid kinase n=1 Tax=unclassified Nocardia TaxID=2637762 RepID=UPI003D1AE827